MLYLQIDKIVIFSIFHAIFIVLTSSCALRPIEKNKSEIKGNLVANTTSVISEDETLELFWALTPDTIFRSFKDNNYSQAIEVIKGLGYSFVGEASKNRESLNTYIFEYKNNKIERELLYFNTDVRKQDELVSTLRFTCFYSSNVASQTIERIHALAKLYFGEARKENTSDLRYSAWDIKNKDSYYSIALLSRFGDRCVVFSSCNKEFLSEQVCSNSLRKVIYSINNK